MQRHIRIESIEGERAGGVISVDSCPEENEGQIMLQVTAMAAPVDSAYIFLNPDEAQEVADALNAALATLANRNQP